MSVESRQTLWILSKSALVSQLLDRYHQPLSIIVLFVIPRITTPVNHAFFLMEFPMASMELWSINQTETYIRTYFNSSTNGSLCVNAYPLLSFANFGGFVILWYDLFRWIAYGYLASESNLKTGKETRHSYLLNAISD